MLLGTWKFAMVHQFHQGQPWPLAVLRVWRSWVWSTLDSFGTVTTRSRESGWRRSHWRKSYQRPDKSESHEEYRKSDAILDAITIVCLIFFEHLIYHFSAKSCHIKPFEYNIIPLKKKNTHTFQDLRFISGLAVPGNGSQIFPWQRWTPSRKPGKFTAGSWKSPAWKGSFIFQISMFVGSKC